MTIESLNRKGFVLSYRVFLSKGKVRSFCGWAIRFYCLFDYTRVL